VSVQSNLLQVDGIDCGDGSQSPATTSCAEMLCTEEHAEFERHVEARRFGIGIKLWTGEIV
jgi:hypothetical protein